MAIRPVFITKNRSPFYEEINTEFVFYSGFAESQQRKSVASLHDAYLSIHPQYKLLEVSTRSDVPLGQSLSAFNLKYCLSDIWYSVENIFQSSKVFEFGGPYKDLLFVPSYAAKKDARLHESGALVGFNFQDLDFPLYPKTFFYDWIYISALFQNSNLSKQLMIYNAFTDIAFNPKKSINCQARSAAVYVSLALTGKLDQALSSPATFRDVVYNENLSDNITFEQPSLFDS